MKYQLTTLLIFVLLHSIINLNGQEDLSWWNEAHSWDGHTHWTSYIILSPYYMGPNALEIPRSIKGELNTSGVFRGDFVSHFRNGSETQNAFFSLYLPLVENIVSVELYGVPWENYQMEPDVVIERRTRNITGKGRAIGDLYFSTMIQLLKKESYPEVVFRMACRTASGSKLEDARYADSPGYFFDVSLGKSYQFNEQRNSLRWHGMLGFYAWQMNMAKNRQNDAFLIGAGLDLTIRNWEFNNAIEGYLGYLGKESIAVGNLNQMIPYNDQPVVLRSELGKRIGQGKIFLRLQQGLNQFPVTSFAVSYHHSFDFQMGK